jgi:hypothetical protein
MFYVVRETALEVEHAISGTLLFFGVGNTELARQEWYLQRAFLWMF